VKGVEPRWRGVSAGIRDVAGGRAADAHEVLELFFLIRLAEPVRSTL